MYRQDGRSFYWRTHGLNGWQWLVLEILLRKKDFTTKAESVSRKRKGKRQYLNNPQTRDLMKRLYRYFEREVEVPRMRIGKRQTIETLINEEALLFAKFLRDERKTWIPRIAVLR